jgi:hypothetical protein
VPEEGEGLFGGALRLLGYFPEIRRDSRLYTPLVCAGDILFIELLEIFVQFGLPSLAILFLGVKLETP